MAYYFYGKGAKTVHTVSVHVYQKSVQGSFYQLFIDDSGAMVVVPLSPLNQHGSGPRWKTSPFTIHSMLNCYRHAAWLGLKPPSACF